MNMTVVEVWVDTCDCTCHMRHGATSMLQYGFEPGSTTLPWVMQCSWARWRPNSRAMITLRTRTSTARRGATAASARGVRSSFKSRILYCGNIPVRSTLGRSPSNTPVRSTRGRSPARSTRTSTPRAPGAEPRLAASLFLHVECRRIQALRSSVFVRVA